MRHIVFDTETCGFHGPIVLVQYCEDDGPIILYCPWHNPINTTLELFERFVDSGVIGFNLTFDWFHVCQMYTTLLLLKDKFGGGVCPIYHINDYAELEPEARLGPCLKPRTAMDLFLHARKGKFQSTMNRKALVVRRVPKVLAYALRDELDKRIQFDPIYFARKKKDIHERWVVCDIDDEPELKDVVLRFRPSSSLKVLAKTALGKKNVLTMRDVEVPRKYQPLELGYAPFALALSDRKRRWMCPRNTVKKSWKGSGFAWPFMIKYHIQHWTGNDLARQYAKADVENTKGLYDYFGKPELGDDDSILACMVGAVRWRGFAVDIDGLVKLRKTYLRKSVSAPKGPNQVRAYIAEVMSPLEVKLSKLDQNTKGVTLEAIGDMKTEDGGTHPAAKRALQCLEARRSKKKVEIFDKLIRAGRFHASFKVIGALSSRMAGADGLNAQGIGHLEIIRRQFPLADDGLVLCGGDFAGFEVSIADAEYNDPVLREQLCTCAVCKYVCTPEQYSDDSLFCPSCKSTHAQCKSCKKLSIIKQGSLYTCCGKTLKPSDPPYRKIHGLFGMALNPEMDYDQVLVTKGSDDDWYDKGKRGFFSQLYQGDEHTLVERLKIELSQAVSARDRFFNRYLGVKRAQQKIQNDFCSMRQPGGIGSKVIWHEPKDYAETRLGFRRYFTLENRVCRTLFQMAENLPAGWKRLQGRVRRRERDQNIGGAVMSALFGAAFNVQAKNMRAAGNHNIQGLGAQLCKRLQCCLWSLQPQGVNEWRIVPMNIHDEIMAPAKPEAKEEISGIVHTFVQEHRAIVPLLKIDWSNNLTSWADK